MKQRSKFIEGTLPKTAPAVAVIMAGGHGTRFWPQSRKKIPKQFLRFGKQGESFIEQTAARLAPVVSREAMLISTGFEHLPLVREALPGTVMIAEPVSRNTAPALGFAALKVMHDVGDVPMICLPSDHIIGNQSVFVEILNKALALSKSDTVFCTVGISPTRAETGYGYIERGERYQDGSFRVKRFTEKPDRTTAETFIQSGNFFWNGGIFVFRPSVLFAAMKHFMPDTLKSLQSLVSLFDAPDDEKLVHIFSAIEAQSIDFGIMEKADNVIVMASGATPQENIGWSDVGSWEAWAECLSAADFDGSGNYLQGQGVLINSQSSVILSSGRFIAGVGLKNLIIVDTPEATLVLDREHAQEVKKVVEQLIKEKRDDLL